jgi:hypothetical protein
MPKRKDSTIESIDDKRQKISKEEEGSSFLDKLPPEMVERICKKMDLTTLARWMRTSKVHYQICKNVYEKRKRENVPYVLEGLESGYDVTVAQTYRALVGREQDFPIICDPWVSKIFMIGVKKSTRRLLEKLTREVGQRTRKNVYAFFDHRVNDGVASWLSYIYYDVHRDMIIIDRLKMRSKTGMVILPPECLRNDITKIPVSNVYVRSADMKKYISLKRFVQDIFQQDSIVIIRVANIFNFLK